MALPAQGLTLRTDATGGAVLVRADEGAPDPLTGGPDAAREAPPREVPLHVPAPDAGKLRIAVSRTRPPEFVRRLAEKVSLDVELVPIGSAGAKISAVLLGEVDAYVHAGGQYEWDSAAPAAVAFGSGAHASRIDGSPLEYNREDPGSRISWCAIPCRRRRCCPASGTCCPAGAVLPPSIVNGALPYRRLTDRPPHGRD